MAARVFIIAALLALTACGEVRIKEPIGNEPVALKSEDWEGLWVSRNWPPYHVFIDDEAIGAVRLCQVADFKRGGTLSVELVCRAGLARKLGMLDDAVVLNISAEPNSSQGPWVFALLQRRRSQLIAWVPRTETFEELVKAGQLEGTIEHKNYETIVNLGELAEGLIIKAVQDEKADQLIMWREPLIFERFKWSRK